MHEGPEGKAGDEAGEGKEDDSQHGDPQRL